MAHKSQGIPPISTWELHCIAPYAPAEAINREIDRLEYFETFLPDGRPALTEWRPEHQDAITQQMLGAGCKSVQWHHITLDTCDAILDSIRKTAATVLFNLADGQETDGWPGVTILSGIEKRNFAYTGSNSYFLELDNMKRNMKRALVESGASTPGYFDLTDRNLVKEAACAEMDKLTYPLLVKPSPSSSSRGLTEDCVCYDAEKAWNVGLKLREDFGGAYAEEFIVGLISSTDMDQKDFIKG